MTTELLKRDFKELLIVVDEDDVTYNYFTYTYNEKQLTTKIIDYVNHLWAEHFIHDSDYGMIYDDKDIIGSLEPKEWYINVIAIRSFLLKYDERFKDVLGGIR